LSNAQGPKKDNTTQNFALIGRFMQEHANLEWSVDRTLKKLCGLNPISVFIIADNITYFNKVRVIESFLKDAYETYEESTFEFSKQEAMTIVGELGKLNDLRILVAHRPFTFSETGVEFKNVTAKGKLRFELKTISYEALEAAIQYIGVVKAALDNMASKLEKHSACRR
jgi:hypothetical protein